jgi:hypothetical protein
MGLPPLCGLSVISVGSSRHEADLPNPPAVAAAGCCVLLPQGYAERKVLLLVDVVRAVRELHAAGAKAERAKVTAACRQVRGGSWRCSISIMHMQPSSFD